LQLAVFLTLRQGNFFDAVQGLPRSSANTITANSGGNDGQYMQIPSQSQAHSFLKNSRQQLPRLLFVRARLIFLL
jgi:hypothetical protein